MRTLWRFIAGFFKWTWRLLNFVREMVLNLFFIFLVLVGVGFGCRSVVVIRKKRPVVAHCCWTFLV
ncbi:signal peptide peptidase SppA, 67K type [Escherichia coli]|nr:signal peptide peptidase SppA, 67K type [Escherichia coli]